MAFATNYSITPLLTRILPGAGPNRNSDTVGLRDGGWVTVADAPAGSSVPTFYDSAGTARPHLVNAFAGDTKIAQLTNGDVVMAGTHSGGGIDFLIQPSTGSTLHAGTVTASASASNADVAGLTGGGFAVAFQSDFSGGTLSGDHDILVYVLNSLGNLTTGFSVDLSAANDQNASVAGLADGGIAVAWERIDGSGNSTAWYAVYEANGSVRKAPSQFDGLGTINHQMSVTALPSGGFAVSYEDNEWGGPPSNISVVTFVADGTNYNYAVSLPTSDSEAAITTLSNGFMMSTFTNLSDSDHGVYDIRGTLLGPVGELLTNRSDPLTIDASGDADGQSSVSAMGLAQFVVSYSRENNQDVVQKTYQLTRTATGDASDDSFTGDDAVDIVNGMGGNDTLGGAANNDALVGGDGLDALHGGAGNDSLSGGTGNDLLFGDAGNDWLDGGTEGDGLAGGTGNDTYIVDSVGDAVSETSALVTEIDTVRSSVSFALGTNVENLLLTGGKAASGLGNGLANTIIGNAAANVIDGGSGKDILAGGRGKDKLTGGANADVFRFNTALGSSNIDKITDFAHVKDTIELENAIMVGLGSIFEANEFIARSAGHAATRANQHIIYDKSNGSLWYDSDGKGSHAAVQLAQLGTSASHPTNLDHTDFAII